MRFFICDASDRGEVPCCFTERGFNRLREGSDLHKRCIRHGALITDEREFTSPEEARAWARGERKED